MKIIGDFHVHSKYARATSKFSDLENNYRWANIKGIDLVGTGDFTHPKWYQELRDKLEPEGTGFYRLKGTTTGARFILTTEISCIYSKNGKVRRGHYLIFSPSLESVGRLIKALDEIGNLAADGRPILGLDAKELLAIALETDPRHFFVPAHVWTPWFSVFGSKSGFDSLEECFEDLTPHIFALETGLSSDPEMNWRWSELDNLALLSNSDAHSPQNLGREANVFDLPELTYDALISAIKDRDPKRFLYTIEFFPEEGKYHLDGHRDCKIVMTPKETKKHHGTCPQCKKPLTIGVLNRVDNLADRTDGRKMSRATPFKSIFPLPEVLAEVLGKSKTSQTVQREYEKIIRHGGHEFHLLLDATPDELLKYTTSDIATAIMAVRKGRVIKHGGYDGVYGSIKLNPKHLKRSKQSKPL